MKNILILLFALILFSCKQTPKETQDIASNTTDTSKMTSHSISKESIYQFKVEDLEGNPFDFSTLKGKRL